MKLLRVGVTKLGLRLSPVACSSGFFPLQLKAEMFSQCFVISWSGSVFLSIPFSLPPKKAKSGR